MSRDKRNRNTAERKAYQRAYRIKNKHKLKEYNKRYYIKNKVKILKATKAYGKAHRKERQTQVNEKRKTKNKKVSAN